MSFIGMQHHKPHLGKPQKTFSLNIQLVETRHREYEKNPCGGEKDRHEEFIPSTGLRTFAGPSA
jgi:hypothetical protein